MRGRQQLAQHAFRGGIHRRGVDELRARRRRRRSSTSFSGARSAGDAPTSNGPDVPSPMTGIASPLEGILRVMQRARARRARARSNGCPCRHRQPSNDHIASIHVRSPATSTLDVPRVACSSDQRSVRLRHTRRATRHDARVRQRARQHLLGVEPRAAQLRRVEIPIRAGRACRPQHLPPSPSASRRARSHTA